jgi:RNA polymerase sigma-70 factor (ECF subfamily)
MLLTIAGGGPSMRANLPREPTLEVVGRAASGDRAAFGDLYGAYAEDVGRLCRRLLGPGDEAQDARSEVFFRAQQALPSFDPARPFRRWLLAIAAHHCLDRLRRRSVEGRLFSTAELSELDLPVAGPSPLGLALARERREELIAALDALPERQRAPLVLRYFAELPYDAIAELLGVSSRDVGVLLYRAKARLRTALSEGGGS